MQWQEDSEEDIHVHEQHKHGSTLASAKKNIPTPGDDIASSQSSISSLGRILTAEQQPFLKKMQSAV